MTHRSVTIADRTIEVFDTTLGAYRWAKRHPQDCLIICRNKFFFQRRAGAEMTVRLNATDNPQNRHLVAAANSLADEVEAALMERAA
jgi:hypothetical protein